MFQNLGLQMFTVRDFITDPEFADLSFRRLRELGYTETQLAGHAFDAKLFGELLAKNGIRVVGNHCSLDDIINRPDETMEKHRMWGTSNLGIGGIPHEARAGVKELAKFIDTYNKAAEVYAKEGFKLTFHNHNYEFEPIDGCKTPMEIFAEEFDPNNISFVLDTCWVAAGGADVRAWMERLAGRIDILHLKDLEATKVANARSPEFNVTEIGNGNLYWDGIMETAEKIGVKYYVVEQDNNFKGTPFDSLRMSAEYLKKYQK
ncbi:MAG: sugar phosphate isomerase/epimerase [Ruminococcaceae bacterium]|nr:sugar phosphate isomerase/epimerase [Oscillospiraceae bacterium]